MLKRLLAVLIVLIGASALFAQMTPDEAMEKLRDKQAAATTQPADPLQEIAELKAVIATQAKQIDGLKAEIVTLKSGGDAAPPEANAANIPNAIRPRSNHSDRNPDKSNPVLVAHAREVDSDIDRYATSHNTDPKFVASMHEGIPMIGMSEDCLQAFLRITVVDQDMTSKTYSATERFGYADHGPSSWDIIVEGSVVTSISATSETDN